ncbi:C1 family peptidase [Flavobacterium sp. LS1R47]|uniref:C1 family peptidase n=1 Tax=Flavobacterium frigoritolerans TaxID=2987686 RepID=A0A9X3C1T6_9FLAO|nr:C1 family peptidase [Flavobacterium frigoritolerans]MCV9932906.1 C1 family peptidase [Flavobacterium frigoritolerans]
MKNSFVKLGGALFASLLICSCHKDDIDKTSENAARNEERATGYIPSTPEQLAQIKEIQSSSHYRKTALPSRYLLPELPAALNQGYKGSCVAYSIAHARTIISDESKTLADGSPNYNAYASADYLYEKYKYSKNSCGAGVFFIEALDALKTEGTPSYSEFGLVTCNTIPTSALEKNARKFRVNDYYRISPDKGLPTLEDIKRQISTGNPVMMGVEVDMAFTNSSIRMWDINTSKFYGRHAVLLTGYDESRQAFRLLNSWGSTWGENGYIWASYKKIKELLTQDIFVLQKDNALAYKSASSCFVNVVKNINNINDNISFTTSQKSAFITNGEFNWNNSLIKPFYDLYNNLSLELSYFTPTNDGIDVDGDLTIEVRLKIESTKNTTYPSDKEKGLELELWNGKYGGKDQYISCNVPLNGTSTVSIFKNKLGETYKYEVFYFLINAGRNDNAFATDKTIRFHIRNGQFYIGDTYLGEVPKMPSGINRFRSFYIKHIGAIGSVTDIRIYKNGKQIGIENFDGNSTTIPMPWLKWYE